MSLLLPLAALAAPLLAPPAPQDEDVERRIRGFETFVNSAGGPAIDTFIDGHVAASLVDSMGRAKLADWLETTRKRCGQAGGLLLRPLPDGFQFDFDRDTVIWRVDVTLEPDPPRKVTGLTIERREPEAGIEPFAWDDFQDRLREYEAEGFSGTVLVVRHGRVVLHRGYGFADREAGIRNRPDTVFAVGSVPIDFTKAAILLLEQRGQLSTAHSIAEYLPDVPRDKAAITLEHLMTGRSGLPNFHGDRDLDDDLDLSYIDRAEALGRIFGKDLLFAPGAGRAHSHSAWGVLAAIVEVVSGQDYGTFVREQLFTPAGMTHTGNYEICSDIDPRDIAVGEGARPFGKKSAPQNWGRTSWLVMGSGGMVSTTIDLHRWIDALHAGRILGPEALERYWVGGIMAGGNDRGFVCMFNEGPDCLAIVCSNSHTDGRDVSSQVAGELARLADRSNVMPFSIGLAADVADEVRIVRVVADSAADAAGLRRGDVVRSVGGEGTEVFGRRIRQAARSGAPLELTVVRGSEVIELTIEPRARH